MKNKNKISKGTIIFLSIFGAITVAAFALSQYIYGPNSVFYQNVSENVFINTLYQKIPALINSIQIITVAIVVNMVLRILLHKILAHSKRGKTISTLVISFVKYLIAIIAILMILAAWGADTRALLASAGILGLVIGLGAQSLIADILAGIFIVFEGEFQVGDIIVVDGWRGTVSEIGIRTTKIIDAGGNLKIVNNSTISSVVNQTKELSLAKTYISIEYSQSIPQVELVIKNNIERIQKAIPEIVEGPFYKGVDNLGPSSVDLLFIARCKEENLYIVQRAMNRELKMIFDENNINIPFPQVTVSQLDNSASAKQTHKQLKEANNFVSEQIELSKDLEDKKS